MMYTLISMYKPINIKTNMFFMCYRTKRRMDRRDKIPSRLPITSENISLETTPPAPKVHNVPRRTPPRSPAPPITLSNPRSPAARLLNDYTFTNVGGNVSNAAPVPSIHRAAAPVIHTQPHRLKDPSPDPNTVQESCAESIICKNCGRCKCKQCTTPRELPKKWIKQSDTECSAECCVEYCTCLNVVKCVFQTMDIRDHEHEMSLADDPCTCCSEAHCCQRWTVMGLLSICLPCLCFYPLLKCGLTACTSCYNRVTRRGCTCRVNKLPGSKRLLIDSENSSST